MEESKPPVDRHKVKRHPESTSLKVSWRVVIATGRVPPGYLHSVVEPTPPTSPLASKGGTALVRMRKIPITHPDVALISLVKAFHILIRRGRARLGLDGGSSFCPRGSNSLEGLELLKTAS
ncbi:hypothetical protein PGT21_023209 [Puccinia graminis f. sp. tritici]|uniref:Uncharacterized protein n=1 Tax=Puccinia graminis f. sp. tritici TaxID=56615 RepID=A0A5B0MTL6_PUCGR|nr:hypothetical protein PGT21_023209 [Puccinia graminis f. sp. tritici]KAA1100785.1 hypothetical protein PGTUg99_027061 [Puccinia graminis f. sp. tritici]